MMIKEMGKLNIWVIKEGEALPIRENARLMRTGMLAGYLSKKGHKVTWWSSTYIHAEKKYISGKMKTTKVNDNLRLVLLHSHLAYKKNMSLSRMAYHYILALQFRKYCKKYRAPDVILCSWPTPQFAKAAVEYGCRAGIPVIIDVRDQWPDIYYRVFPKMLQGVGKILIKPLQISARKTFHKAVSITGTVPSRVRWGCKYAGRNQGAYDRVIYIGNEEIGKITEADINWWKDRGIDHTTWNLCFFSVFGKHIEIETVIEAVKKLSEEKLDIKLVIGGFGDREKELKERAEGCSNIYFAGWLDKIQMNSLMSISKCGVFSIKNTEDFRDTFNNKAIQYMAAGLPILNSLSGFAKCLINEKGMGLTYLEGDVGDCQKKIRYLYENEKMRKIMSVNAKRCFEEMFNGNVVNEKFEKLLLDVATKNA